VAIIYDWENRWAIEDAQGPRQEHRDYQETGMNHYEAFWTRGIPVDVIDMESDFARYTLLIAPMLYMVRSGVAERLEAFVAAGGTLVTTYWSGVVDEHDLCFLGGFPGPLRKVTGIWAEEIDALHDHDRNALVCAPANQLGLTGEYTLHTFCELIHTETAATLATYRDDFYAGRPALTVNRFGQGQAYYIAARTDQCFLHDFYGQLSGALSLQRALNTELPEGVTVQVRSDGTREFLFFLNFANAAKIVALGATQLTDLVTGQIWTNAMTLPPYGVKVVERPRSRG
jgi:beta-galactosidase